MTQVEELQQLSPLQKRHFSWPMPLDNLSDDLLYEYIRLTNGISLHTRVVTPEQIRRCIAICKQVNDTNPVLPAALGLVYSPWHYTIPAGSPATVDGTAELQLMREAFEKVAAVVDDEADNLCRHENPIAVVQVMLDSERFFISGDPVIDAALDAKYNASYDLAKEIFPAAYVDYYARGSVQPVNEPVAWKQAPYFTLNEKSDSINAILYRPHEYYGQREIVRRTYDVMTAKGETEMSAWLGIGFGQVRTPEAKLGKSQFSYDHPIIDSYGLGQEINNPWYGSAAHYERFAPWNAIKRIFFYPEPYGRSETFHKHFVAYVKGANGITEL